MKILITTDPEVPVPPVLYGGAERIANYLAMGLRQEGFEIILMSNKRSTCHFASKIYAWPANNSRGIINSLRNSFTLLKCLYIEKPDIIYCFSRIIYLYLPALLTKHRFIKRYGRYISPKSTRIANKLLGKRIHYVALANHMISHLNFPSKISIIPNCVDFNFYFDDSKIQKTHLTFLGRIEPIKGTYEAIQIAIKTKQKLIIAGNVPQEHTSYFEEKVKPFLNDDIKYIGPVNDFQKRTLLQGSKALLFPINLKVEAFGIVMIESLACGTPVIGKNIAAVPEVIIDGFNGYVCNSINEMAEKVSSLNKINRIKLRQHAFKNYSIQAVTQKHILLFNKLNKK